MNVVVLLAAYSGEKWLAEQIESILYQTDVASTIFINLDLSSDDSLALCEKLVEQYSKYSAIALCSKFDGAGKSFYLLIRGIYFNCFDYVALSDQDDIWLPNKLGHAAIQMQSQS